jgi:predicted anti-sigma-YlaC factor YlaD
MLTCKELARQYASDYLDHELTPRQRFSVRVHLMLCRNCRRFINQLKMVRDVLRRSPQPMEETHLQATAARLHAAYQKEKKSEPLL